MAKFTTEEKLNAIKSYLEGKESQKSIADSIGVNRAVFQNWLKQYEYNGEKAFEKSYTSYNGQFKLNVLNYMYNNGTSPNEAAAIYNIPSAGMIRKWRIQFESQGIDVLESQKKGRSTMDKETKKIKAVEGSVEVLQ